MEKIDRDSSSHSGITLGTNVWHLVFADDLTFLSLKESILQYALDWFFDACLDAGIKISTIKTEIIYLSRHPAHCSFQINGVTIQQLKKFKYLGVTL